MHITPAERLKMLVKESGSQAYIVPAAILGGVPAVVILLVGLVASPASWLWVVLLALVVLAALGSAPFVLRFSYRMASGSMSESVPMVLVEMLAFIPIAVLLASRIPAAADILLAMLSASVPLALLGALGLSYVLYILASAVTLCMVEATTDMDFIRKANEGEFESQLLSFWEASVRYGDPLSFALVGLDPGASGVQKNASPAELGELVQRVQGSVRKSDRCGPESGDTVWVIFARTGEEDARTALTRVVDNVGRSRMFRERQIRSAVRSFSSAEQDPDASVAALRKEYARSASGVV